MCTHVTTCSVMRPLTFQQGCPMIWETCQSVSTSLWHCRTNPKLVSLPSHATLHRQVRNTYIALYIRIVRNTYIALYIRIYREEYIYSTVYTYSEEYIYSTVSESTVVLSK